MEELRYPELTVYACPCGCGRHVIAGPNHDHTGYWGPQSARAQRVTGCSGLVARRVDTLAHDGVALRYRSRASALRVLRARYERGEETP